jgi:hypothetical protein
MSASAVTLITYVLHYLFARLLYEQLLRPLIHGDPSGLVLLGCVAATAFLIGRWTGRHA